MPTFDYPNILWGLPLVGLPVLIHLINMFRHKRVAWAAMEFLEISRKKNRTRILLKQLLLLLLRMAAIAAVVFMLAKPRMPNDWDGPLSGETLHYVVLLDDSYSMNEQSPMAASASNHLTPMQPDQGVRHLTSAQSLMAASASKTLFDEAKAVVERIAKNAIEEGRPATLTIIPFSRTNTGVLTYEHFRNGSELGVATKGVDPETLTDRTPSHLAEIDSDFLEIDINEFFSESLKNKWDDMNCSQTSVSPEHAVEGLRTLFADSPPRRRAVYIVSDFRRKDWEETDSLRDALFDLQEQGARYRLIACAESPRPNLGVMRLDLLSTVQVAGAPLVMEVEVTNYSPRDVGPVIVQILADDIPRRTVEIDSIPSGGKAAQSFTLTLPDEGEYRITARIESDIVPDVIPDDDKRYRVISLSAGSPVLLIDGDTSAQNARYVSAALAPQGAVDTGIRPRVESPLFLNNADLDDFHVVFLLDPPRLNSTAVQRLEEYLKDGGNVCVFLGPLTDPDHVNQDWFRGGEGFFPVPLDEQDLLTYEHFRNGSELGVATKGVLTQDGLNPAPDVRFEDHSAFRLFEGENNSYASLLRIDRYLSVSDTLFEQRSETTKIVASLRGNAPLICERSFGEGRVLAFLTTASPQWNNWARGNPLFVILLQESYAYLLSNERMSPASQVGVPIEVSFDPKIYEEVITARLRSTEDEEDQIFATVQDSNNEISSVWIPKTAAAGFYDVELATREGNLETRTFAVNVDSREGDLALIDRQSLDDHLQGVKYEFFDLMRFRGQSEENAGLDLSTPLLFLLIVILIGEQLLACSMTGPSRSRSKNQIFDPAESAGRPTPSTPSLTSGRGRPSAHSFFRGVLTSPLVRNGSEALFTLRGAAELPLRLLRVFESDRKGRKQR